MHCVKMRATLKNAFTRHMFTIGNPDLVNPIPVIGQAWDAAVLSAEYYS